MVKKRLGNAVIISVVGDGIHWTGTNERLIRHADPGFVLFQEQPSTLQDV